MDTIFISSKNSKTYDHYRLLLNLSNIINLKWGDKYVALSTLSIYYKRENERCHTEIINLKYQLQCEMKNLYHQMDHILHQIFKIILNIS